jgi:hypothetical protein
MFFPSVVSAVVAGHVKGAADALAKSWKLQDEWVATPLGKTGVEPPVQPVRRDWKEVETAWSVSWCHGSSRPPEVRITGRPGERIGSNDDEKVPA